MQTNNPVESARSPRYRFLLAQVGRNCWVVACNGRLIRGAALSSLRAATDYVAQIATDGGRGEFDLRVMPVNAKAA